MTDVVRDEQLEWGLGAVARIVASVSRELDIGDLSAASHLTEPWLDGC